MGMTDLTALCPGGGPKLKKLCTPKFGIETPLAYGLAFFREVAEENKLFSHCFMIDLLCIQFDHARHAVRSLTTYAYKSFGKRWASDVDNVIGQRLDN